MTSGLVSKRENGNVLLLMFLFINKYKKIMKHESFSRCKNRDSRLNCAPPKSKNNPDVHLNKPLKGRIFYLDLPLNRKTRTLEHDIKHLGGTVEKFFSKEIKYLVSSKPEARDVPRLLPDSPAPSPDSDASSPRPSSRRDRHRDRLQGATDTAAVSRGKSLVERVVKEQERIHINGILSNAVEWGVKILHVDDVISYVDKWKAKKVPVKAAAPAVKGSVKIKPTEKTTYQRYRAGRISRPFVKVEDSSRHYRPIYLHVSNMPSCNKRSLPPCSPFLMEKDDEKKKQKEERSGDEQGAKEKTDRQRGHEGREKRKEGYCECCKVKFDNLKVHLDGTQHQTFSKSEEYSVVDRVIAGLTCDLMNISMKTNRVKCSVSSPPLHAAIMPVVKKETEAVDSDEKMRNEEFVLLGFTGKQPLSEQTTDRSALVRKRSRGQCEFSWSNTDSLLDPSDVLEKSQSKRGSYEWEFCSHSAVRKYEGGSFLHREKNSVSYTGEYRADHDINPCQLFSEDNIESVPGNGECFRTNCSGMYTNSVQENQAETSAFWPFASTEPEPNPDSNSSSLQRKVPNVRPRRRLEGPAVHMQSSKERESLVSLSPVKDLQQSENASVWALDLWQLLQFSNNIDEDFKDFSD